MSTNSSTGLMMADNKKGFVTYASTVTNTLVYQNVPHNMSREEPEVFQDAPATENKVLPKYEAVFFAKYGFKDMQPRPVIDDITKLFSNYGVVHHVTYPENKQFAIIFMTSLVSKAVHQRANAVIGDIINDMTMENRFHVSIANSKRTNNKNPGHKKTQYASDFPPRILKNNTRYNRQQNDGSFVNPQFRAKKTPQQATN